MRKKKLVSRAGGGSPGNGPIRAIQMIEVRVGLCHPVWIGVDAPGRAESSGRSSVRSRSSAHWSSYLRPTTGGTVWGVDADTGRVLWRGAVRGFTFKGGLSLAPDLLLVGAASPANALVAFGVAQPGLSAPHLGIALRP